MKASKDHPAQVSRIIDELVRDFVYSTNANAQCGGLISLAATAIALGSASIIIHTSYIEKSTNNS